jgi:hypothetical protein
MSYQLLGGGIMYSVRRVHWWSRRHEWTAVWGSTMRCGTAPTKAEAHMAIDWAFDEMLEESC